MLSEQDIKTIRNADGRGTIKVLILESCAGGKHFIVMSLDARSNGNRFVVRASQIID